MPAAPATPAPASVRVLGIDPGSRITGYGVIEVGPGGKLTLLDCGPIRAGDGPLAGRLVTIHRAVVELVERWQPDHAAIEEVFMKNNVASALVLGQARGVALLAMAAAGLDVAEYAPTQVKMAVVGSGRAEKVQIQQMVRYLLKLTGPLQTDAADAVAIAITHAHARASLDRSKGALRGTWNA